MHNRAFALYFAPGNLEIGYRAAPEGARDKMEAYLNAHLRFNKFF